MNQCGNIPCQEIDLVAFSAKLLQFTSDALAEFKLPPAESKALMFISLQRELLQSIGSSLTLSQALKASENLDSMLVPGLIAGSRVDNVAVCTSIVNLLALLGKKILYDSGLNSIQEQRFSQQLWNIAGGLLQLQTRSASPGFKISVSSDISFLSFDMYRVDSTSQRGRDVWIFSSTSERKELGANFSIPKNVIPDTSVLDVIATVQEFAWKSSDPNYMTSLESKVVSSSKKFSIVGAVYGLKLFDTSKANSSIYTLSACFNLSVSFDSLKVRQWVPQQRKAKVSIATYDSTSNMYSSENCLTKDVGPSHVQSCCKTVSQFAVKITPDATICGDGFADVDYGEECDDGNLIDGDGCDSKCSVEQFYKCEHSIPDRCIIMPTNVSSNCIPPRTCSGRGLYTGGSGCVCEPTYFRANCSLKLTPLAAPSLIHHGDTHVLVPGLQFSMTSTNTISSVTIAAYNDSDVYDRAQFRENGRTGEIMRSTQMQFEFNPPVDVKNSIISIKLNVSGLASWLGRPMLVMSNYNFLCLKPRACLWTQMRSKIISDYVMQVTVSSVDIATLQRCAIFELSNVLEPMIPAPADESSLLVVYIGSATFLLALILFFARRKYMQMQAAKSIIDLASLPVDCENDVQVTGAPSKASLTPVASVSSERLQIQSSPRELVEVDDLNIDVDLLDSTILATIMDTEQLPSSQMTMPPIAPNRSMSVSPSSGKSDARRPVLPPVQPRTPDGRRRPKVNSSLTPQSQNNALEFQSPANLTARERFRASKSLSPTDRLSLQNLAMNTIMRPEPSGRADKSNVSNAELTSTRVSTGSRTKMTGISPPPKVSVSSVARTTNVPIGLSRIQRTRILRDADEDQSTTEGRMVLSDVYTVAPRDSIARSNISLETAFNLRQQSDILQDSAIDIDSISPSR
jgi:cysteine-rich repeat protein